MARSSSPAPPWTAGSSSAAETAVVEAAGGLVERRTPPGPLIAVVLRDRYGTEWALPKGKRAPGESWQETALREVREETGLSPTIVGLAGASTYVANGSPKLVVYWRMRVHEVPAFVPNEETKRLDWLTPEEAVMRLSHPDQSELVSTVYGQDVVPAASSWLARAWRTRAASVVQATRWHRLVAEVDAYRGEVEGRALIQQRLGAALPAILSLLTRARQAVEGGDIDRGWRCLHTARRLELLGLDDSELHAAAETIRDEAEKLDGWRKKAVTSLVTPKDATAPPLSKVFRAATLRDEHYDNQAYKDALRRGHAVRLAIVLGAVVAALFVWVKTGALSGADWAHVVDLTGATVIDRTGAPLVDLYKALVSVVIFGLLGATVSAVLAAPGSRGTTRIPETASTVRVTVLRLFMGPAAAILLYFVCQSKLAKSIFRFDAADAYTVLAIAFVAGFSERLVLRVVETIAGKPGDKEKDPHADRR